MGEKLYPWRWLILLTMLVQLVGSQFAFYLPGGAAILVMQDYQCEPMAFSMIMNIPYFSGVLFCMLGGMMADRYGMNRVFVVAFSIAVLGCLGRCFTTEYWQLFICSFFIGTGTAALNSNSAKLLRLWFPGTANSFAMGVYTAGMTAGAALSIWVGSHIPILVDGWWASFWFLLIGLVLWIVLYRKHPEGENISKEPVGTYLKEVLKDKYVWAISFTAFLTFGMTNINATYMVAAVTTLLGDPALTGIAGDISSVNRIIACVGCMVLPVLFAKIFPRMRAPFIISVLGSGICFAMVLFFPFGWWTWLILMIQPLFMASSMPFTKMLPTLLPTVKKEHYGVVGGIQATFQNLGMFLIASYIVSPLAIGVTGQTDGLAYYQGIEVLTLVFCILCAVSLFFFPNVRSSVARKISDDEAAAAAASGKPASEGAASKTPSAKEILEDDVEGIMEGGNLDV